MLEILHFVPMALIIAAYLIGSYSSTKTNVIVCAIALAGLAFGSFFHAGHAHHHMIFEPCLAYAAVAAFSAFRAVRVAAAKAVVL